MGGFYSFPNQNSRVNRQSLMWDNSKAIIDLLFFGITVAPGDALISGFSASTITISESVSVSVIGTANITIPTESNITISEQTGTNLIIGALITVPTASNITISEQSGTLIEIISNILLAIPSVSQITISENSGTTIEISAVITIPINNEIFIDNNNPLVEAISILMTISNTLQLQILNSFIEGSETSLDKNGNLTMIEFIEGSGLNFDENGILTAFEFIEGGM